MILILPFIFGAIGLAVGAVTGALTAHAAGEEDRQAASYHRTVANELVEKYANLEKQYYELADESQKQINDVTRQIALSEIEKDYLRLTVRLQQSLISLMWSIDRQPTIDALKQFMEAVDVTNDILCRISEELVSVPSDYYERNFTKAVRASLPAKDFTKNLGNVSKREKRVVKLYSQEFQDTYNRIQDTGDRLLNYIKELRAGRLREGDKTTGLQSIEDSIKKALEALGQQKYQVAVIAAMNAGKSTFLNALIGADVLATSVEACTVFRTNIIPIQGGETPRLLEYRQGQKSPEIIASGSTEEIQAKFVKRTYEIRNTANSDHTTHFELEHPIEAIRDLPSLTGFTLVDTPGPNEWNSESFNTVALKQTTLEALRTCDAILFILDYLSFKDNTNLELLQDLIENRQEFLAQNTGKIYFVLNKVDMRGESDRKIEEVVEFLRNSLVDFGIPEPNICPVSARQGLLAKLIQQGKATSNHINDFENFYSIRYAEKDDRGRKFIPLPEEIADRALEDSGIPTIQDTVIQNIAQNSGWNLLSDVLAILNKAAQSVTDILNTEIRGWELEFEELENKIGEYKRRSDSARDKVRNVKKSLVEERERLITIFSQGVNTFAKTAKNRITQEIDKVAENQYKKNHLVSRSSKKYQDLFQVIFDKIFSWFEDDSNTDIYKIRVKKKKDAEKIGQIINSYCTPIIHDFWIDTQDRLVREGTKIREELVRKIQQEIQAISDELSKYIGDALQVEICINEIQFPKFEFPGIDAKIQEQQKVFERIKKETEGPCCANPHVYEKDVTVKEEVSYYEIDLRQTAQGIHKKIDEQVKNNIILLQRLIEKQIDQDFQKGEQQIDDYITIFQGDFDDLLIQRVNKENQSHEIIAALQNQKSQVSEYLDELIVLREMLDDWKPLYMWVIPYVSW